MKKGNTESFFLNERARMVVGDSVTDYLMETNVAQWVASSRYYIGGDASFLPCSFTEKETCRDCTLTIQIYRDDDSVHSA